MKKVDAAINVFAKPYRTALSLLSLVDKCGDHIGRIWLQFEPVGITYDTFNPYLIVGYLKERGVDCECSQSGEWLAREAADEAMLKDPERRFCVRYQNAFEKSGAEFLFILHNDVVIYKDIVGAMLKEIGGAFAIGRLGQCWNCPASRSSITERAMGCPCCSPDSYQDFRPTVDELRALYREAEKQDVFRRPYDADDFRGEFERQPWPLPECRVNEWACLLNLKMVRDKCLPHGKAWPPGAYRLCAGHNLDIGVPFFRDMHALGMHARNFKTDPYMKHWIGTGNNTPIRYAKGEDEAKRLVEKHYPAFLEWARRQPDNV